MRRRRDLHALVIRHGLELVAQAAGVTVRALLDLRSGRTPLTVDHLLGIARRFRDFDLDGTVARIGAVRIHAGRSRLVDDLAPEVRDTPDPLAEEGLDERRNAREERHRDRASDGGAAAARELAPD